MTLDYAGFTKASTLIHVAQGAGLLLLGAAEAYTLDNPGRKVSLVGPLALLAAAAAIPLLILALPGAWNFDQLRLALEVRRGFHIFPAFACLFGAAGLSRFAQAAMGRRGGGWQALFLFFLAAAGLLYFFMASRVNDEAWRQVLVWHAAAGATLLLAVAFKTVHVLDGRRFFHIVWAALLMITALQLLTYKESPGAFGLRLVTFEAAPDLPSVAGRPTAKPLPKNAGTADKKRSGH
ncbi:MAG: hypothetical protein A2081_00790 [Elusimicrobia bacterium GWC2_61_19]|nr:MAG: hypothetical protein A2081_00790 [Elusimicrobia bacterium GWC2_61_19]